jgi:hypothetical protein
MTNESISRRTLLVSLCSGAAAAWSARASSVQPERLDVKDPQAVSLGYVENASQVDAKKFPSYVKGSTCENCLQLQGMAGSPYRPCAAFKGKLVAVTGWCSAWTPEM